jgi:hypothetical protein
MEYEQSRSQEAPDYFEWLFFSHANHSEDHLDARSFPATRKEIENQVNQSTDTISPTLNEHKPLSLLTYL